MALIACPECGRQVSTQATACPGCGAPVAGAPPLAKPSASPPARSARIWLWIVGVPVGLFVLTMIAGSIRANSPEGRQRSMERRAIELCWDEQKRKSLEPGTQRFVAGACERMEEEFRRQHGTSP